MDEPKKSRRTKKQTTLLHCSFCEKSQHEVRKLIAKDGGTGMDTPSICDECVELSAEFINEQSLIEAADSPKALYEYIVRQHEIIREASDRANKALDLLNVSMPPSTTSRH